MGRVRGWWEDVSHRLFTKTVIVLALLGALWYDNTSGEKAQAQSVKNLAAQNCANLNKQNETIRDYFLSQIARNKEFLPQIAYYKEHPDELRDALRNLERQKKVIIATFKPAPC